METIAFPLHQTHWMKFKEHKIGMFGIYILVFLALGMALGIYFSPFGYDEMYLISKNQAPSLRFWFGTDDLGRDIFTRVCYGARISLLIAGATAFIDLTLGVIIGSVAALSSRTIDEYLMRLLDIFYSIPTLLISILLSVVLGSGLISIVIAVNLVSWITMARIVRGQLLLLKEMDYVQASVSLGAKPLHIFLVHLLPSMWGSILVTLTMTIPAAIFSEAFLSFLGLGIQAPMASWGTMAYEGLPAFQYYPWRLFFPAAFISLTMLSFYLIGEGLKQTFNSHKAVQIL